MSTVYRSFLITLVSAVVLAFVAAPGSRVAALSVPTDHVARAVKAPSTYDSKNLESYDVYNARYNALECVNWHNTDFFTICCGPLKKGQKLSSRPEACDPQNYVDCVEDDD